MEKPTGVVILAILGWVWAACLLIPALALFFGSSFIAAMVGQQFGPIAALAGVVGGAIFLVMALVTAVVSWGLWTLQEWARILTIIMNGLAMVPAVLTLFGWFHPFGIFFRLVRIAVHGVILPGSAQRGSGIQKAGGGVGRLLMPIFAEYAENQ